MSKATTHSRQCALTRTVMPVADLIRFVTDPDGNLVPDIDARAPGRGVWISATRAAVAEAVRKNIFARSLKQKVQVPTELAQVTQTRLEQRLSGALGLARKAGQLQTGATRVKSQIAAKTIIALFTATDAAPDGRRKMVGLFKASGLKGQVPHFDILTAPQLGLALGQQNVIHAALTIGAAANSALKRAQRLARYIAQPDERDDKIND
ncbi:COG2740: Predicted nucleic-acid-binding protein implicated in transcription termination / ribosomal protein L7Ae family protein [hydrothermal vent metagenome]|uniref:COG2740: Predicted nucleic-acid-binding protein implicated in transcription termination / ribosomal protein L7Ae family protein n=1 Tax=hydrothermal vent metagenome TaxID=652676 RepID=A0A3B0TSY1_9ZZZZ